MPALKQQADSPSPLIALVLTERVWSVLAFCSVIVERHAVANKDVAENRDVAFLVVAAHLEPPLSQRTILTMTPLLVNDDASTSG